MTFTSEQSVISQMDEWADKLGCKRSQVIERCILIGVERFKKEFIDPMEKTVKEEEPKEKPNDDTVDKRYMRKILDKNFSDGWVEV